MSRTSTPNTATTIPSAPSSAWSRGPPDASQPDKVNGVNGHNGSAIGHSRKGSLMVGGGVDIQRGNIAFGTVDSPNPLLSSSPAAPSLTGAHLADHVKSFGSIQAETTTDPDAVKASRRTSMVSSPPPQPKQLDMHALFAKRPVVSPPPNPMHERRPSQGAYNNYPIPGQHLRPPPGPNQPRSPVLGQANFTQMQGFRPQSNGQPVRPIPGRPMGMGQYGMHPGPQAPYQMMGYPGQGFYNGYNVYEQQYGMPPQWAPQQHPQNQFIPPRSNGPPGTPSSNGPSPTPTPPNRPPSLMQTPSTSMPSLPTTPSRPQNFTPQSNSSFGLSGGASSFTPRAPTSKGIKLSKPDGTAIDIKEAAAAVKGPVSTPELPASDSAKKVPSLPVVVRLESEEQKKARLAEEEKAERIRKVEEQEEIERKERKERKAREEAKKVQEAEEKAKAEEVAAKEKAEAERAESERAERDRAERAEKERVDKEKIEKERVERERVEKERVEKERVEKEDIEKQRIERERTEAAKLEAERVETEKVAAETASKEAESNETLESKTNGHLATPAIHSTPSPLASPRLAAAGLPPKPVTRPPSLDLKLESPVPDTPTASVTALSTARPIDDLSSIVYPGSLKSPSADLNVDAKPGKYRYDRDFLMQFINVCREKPENLPNLEEIGLEAESSTSGFGGRGGARGARSSVGTSRQTTGLGIGNLGGRNAFPQGMGTFGMGQFGAAGVRGTTSEERYNRSLVPGRTGGMTRTPSSGGNLPPMHGLPAMSQSTSRGGGNRSQRGTKRLPNDNRFQEPDAAPLVSTSNSWVKSFKQGEAEGSPAFIERKVKALLNKLTAEKFDAIAVQILEWANKSVNETDGMTLKLVIKQIFEKATDEAHWSSMYARLCFLLLERTDPAISEVLDGKPVSGGLLFRKYLVGRCQLDFEAGWKAREDAANAAAAKSAEDKAELAKQQEKEGEAAMLSDEYYAAQKAKRRGLGLVQLIGELFKLGMLGKNVIRTCFMKLLSNVEDPDEEDIESTVKLLTTVGKSYEENSKENMTALFERLDIVLKGDVSSRIKFMIMDINDLRRANWESKVKTNANMTIAEIHQQAAKEQQEKSAAAREAISRGGSRTGHQRAGEWQAANTGMRAPSQRPGDFSKLGLSSSGLPSAPSFGFQSTFNKKKAPGVATPPISRQASTTNMFAALQGDGEKSEEPQRRKLQLAPRTVPVEGEEEEAETEPEDEVATLEATGVLSGEAVKSKIETDMKELWGEKDTGGSRNPEDIVEYFKALPEEHQPKLAERLVDDVFRISKIKDADVVGKGWTAVLDQNAATAEILSKGIEAHMPSLDDDAIDFPQAYKAIAILIRSLSLPTEAVDALLAKVDVYGEPKITPRMKLEKALAAVDEGV